jgi:predicted enzyme related to lactoylglutathione lyase
MAYPVVRFEVRGQDADRLRRFYGDLLGWQFQPDPAMAYSTVRQEEGRPGIPGAIGQTGPGHPNWLVFYTEVPNLEDSLSRARALGSRVLMAPVRLRDRVVAVVSDPEGHPVGLCAAC